MFLRSGKCFSIAGSVLDVHGLMPKPEKRFLNQKRNTSRPENHFPHQKNASPTRKHFLHKKNTSQNRRTLPRLQKHFPYYEILVSLQFLHPNKEMFLRSSPTARDAFERCVSSSSIVELHEHAHELTGKFVLHGKSPLRDLQHEFFHCDRSHVQKPLLRLVVCYGRCVEQVRVVTSLPLCLTFRRS